MKGLHSPTILVLIDGTLNVICNSFYVALTNEEAFIQDKGSFIMSILTALVVEEAE